MESGAQKTVSELDYAQKAHNVIRELASRSRGQIVSVTQLRKILFVVNMLASKLEIFRAENPEAKQIDTELSTLLVNLKVKVAYSCARENKVKEFEEAAKLTEQIDAILKTRMIGALEDFIRYNEALIAYHKVEGGRE